MSGTHRTGDIPIFHSECMTSYPVFFCENCGHSHGLSENVADSARIVSLQSSEMRMAKPTYLRLDKVSEVSLAMLSIGAKPNKICARSIYNLRIMAMDPLAELEKNSYALVKWPRQPAPHIPQTTAGPSSSGADAVTVFSKVFQRGEDALIDASRNVNDEHAEAWKLQVGDIFPIEPPEQLRANPITRPVGSDNGKWYGLTLNLPDDKSAQVIWVGLIFISLSSTDKLQCIPRPRPRNAHEKDMGWISSQNTIRIANCDIRFHDGMGATDRGKERNLYEDFGLHVDITRTITVPALHICKHGEVALKLNDKCTALLRCISTHYTADQPLRTLIRDKILAETFRVPQLYDCITYWSLISTFESPPTVTGSSKSEPISAECSAPILKAPMSRLERAGDFRP